MPVMNLEQMKKENVVGGIIIESAKSSATQTGRPPGVSGHNPFEKSSKYRVDGKIFMVEPVFQESGSETIGTILVKLMQADAGNA